MMNVMWMWIYILVTLICFQFRCNWLIYFGIVIMNPYYQELKFVLIEIGLYFSPIPLAGLYIVLFHCPHWIWDMSKLHMGGNSGFFLRNGQTWWTHWVKYCSILWITLHKSVNCWRGDLFIYSFIFSQVHETHLTHVLDSLWFFFQTQVWRYILLICDH